MSKNGLILFDQPLSGIPLNPEFFLPILISLKTEASALCVSVDRFGSKHIYYAHDKKRAAVGVDFEEVSSAASNKRLDWLGIGGFLRFGFFPDDRTYFEDVKILKPATEYVFDEHGNQIKANRRWNWEFKPNYQRTFEEAIDEFAGIFHEVIAEEIENKRVAIPISGGLDSRATVAAIMQVTGDKSPVTGSDRFWAYSYGYSDDSIETKIARQVARVAGLPFDGYAIKPYLFQKIDSIIDVLDGFQDITQARQAFVTEEIASHADAVMCAHWGDVWMDTALSRKSKVESEKLKSKTKDELTEMIFNKFKKKGSDGLLAIFKDQLPRDLDDQLKQGIFKNLKDYDRIQGDDFKVKAYKTDHWSFRWTLASIRMFETAAKPLLPFYDNRIADFFLTVPTDYVLGRRLQIEYLKKYAPDLAKVTWQAFDADLYHYQNFNTWQLPKRIFNKILRTISGRRTIQRNWEAQFLSTDGREGLKHWLVRPHLKLHEFIPAQRLNQEINNFYGDPEENGRGYTVSMLLTLSAWCQRNL